MADQEPIDLEAFRADIDRAHTEVGEICRRTGPGRWRMSIPARPDRDSDLLISTALARGERLADEVERLRAQQAASEATLCEVSTLLTAYETGDWGARGTLDKVRAALDTLKSLGSRQVADRG
ncbi:MAG: hypothetical protein ACRDP6_14805 [Actinoallomurus sp.]